MTNRTESSVTTPTIASHAATGAGEREISPPAPDNSRWALAPVLWTASFFLIGILLIHGLAAVATTYAPRPNDVFTKNEAQRIDRILDASPDLSALAIGNSHTAAIDFATIGENGDFLARAWDDLFQVGYTLDAIVPRLPQVRTVYIPLSYFSFDWDNAASEELSIRRMNMYSTVPSWSFLPGDFVTFLVGKTQPLAPTMLLVREDNWAGVLASLAQAGGGDGGQAAAEATGSDTCEHPSESEFQEIAAARVAQTKVYLEEMQANRPDVVDSSYSSLAATIQALKARNIRVVLFTPPYHAAYIESFQEQMGPTYARMQQKVQELSQTLDVEYYDYSQDPNFTHNAAFFGDSDHLNDCGRTAFSATLNEAMISVAQHTVRPVADGKP